MRSLHERGKNAEEKLPTRAQRAIVAWWLKWKERLEVRPYSGQRSEGLYN